MKKNLFLLILVSLFSCVSQRDTEEITSSKVVSKSDGCESCVLEQYVPSNSNHETLNLPNGWVVEKYGDSTYVFQGDILLTQGQIDQILDSHMNRTTYISEVVNYWKNGIVYYTIDGNNQNFRDAIEYAIINIELSTSIRFVRRTNQQNYIKFQFSSSNSSALGCIGGEQIINIHTIYYGTVMHEICHALGLAHEQCRADRNSYIIVNYDNLTELGAVQFSIVPQGHALVYIGDFDFESIMLYGSTTNDGNIANNTQIPIMTKLDGSFVERQRERLSDMDKATISAIYGPPFHKLETILIDENFDSGWDYQVSQSTYSNNIYFYSDESYTNRVALTYPRRIRVKKTIESYLNGNYSEYSYSYDVIIPAGSTSFNIGESVENITRDYGIPTGERIDYTLVF